MGLGLTSSMLGLLFAKFLTDTVGLPPALVAGAIFMGRTWDWLNDPILGYLSDHIQTRWGRRRPFLLFGAIPFGLIFMALWWIPPIQSQNLLIVYYTLVYILFDTMVTIVFIPYIALTPELTNDYDDRTSLTSYRMFFSLLGSLIGSVVPLIILGGAALPPEKSYIVFGIGLFLAVVSATPFVITFFGTRENIQHVQAKQPSLWKALREMRTNRPYLMAVVIYLATSLGFEVMIGASLYFMQYKLQMPWMAGYTNLSIFAVALIAIPFWLWVSKKLDKAKGYAAAIFYLSIILIIYASFDSHVPIFLPFLFSALAGIGISAGQTLPWAILPDTIDYGEYLSGDRNEGVLYSMMTLARKIASSITFPAILLLLDWSGYVPNAVIQSPLTINTIALMFAGIPVIFFSIGIITALRYPLDRKSFNVIRAKLK